MPKKDPRQIRRETEARYRKKHPDKIRAKQRRWEAKRRLERAHAAFLAFCFRLSQEFSNG